MTPTDLEALRRITQDMAHSSVRNYATPGLTSQLIGSIDLRPDHGKVRMFTADRDTRHFITPHSHRFNFTCLVLRGAVKNVLYVRSDPQGQDSNLYVPAQLVPEYGGLGAYKVMRDENEQPRSYDEVVRVYSAGSTYSMHFAQIHSIYFDRGTEVLFFEGPQVTEVTTILEPYSDGHRVETFESPKWMFEHD